MTACLPVDYICVMFRSSVRRPGLQTRHGPHLKMRPAYEDCGLRLSSGQLDPERRAGARRRLNLDTAAVRLDDGADETQPEAEASLGTAAVATKQTIPDLRELIGGNADAGVLHFERDSGREVGARRSHADAASRGGGPHGVVEQVR